MSEPICPYCKTDSVRPLYLNMVHPLDKEHGSFNFYSCKVCRSGFTFPLPSRDRLTSLYNKFAEGMNPSTRILRDKYPLVVWFKQCLRHALKQSEKELTPTSVFSWIDLGAGKGELSRLLCQEFPNAKGLNVDFHEQPECLTNLPVGWATIDMNDEHFSAKIDARADMLFSITVLEHLLAPDNFLLNAMKLLKPGGSLYINTPSYNNFFSRLLGRRWPYIIPGEHLSMPSLKGMEILLNNIGGKIYPEKNFKVVVRSTILPYPVGYYARHFKLDFLLRILPENWLVRLPTGILEATIVFPN